MADRDGCGGLAWKLTSSPSDNANEVVAGADGIARFTPHVSGKYTFALDGEEGTTETLQAISAEGLPFHNLNYFAGQSVAVVNGELWVANVHAPTLSRLDPTTLKARGSIDVGAWPVAVAWQKGMTHAVVAQRGGDTLGLVDIESGRIVDAIWVGDEPSNVVVSPDGKTAYATLSTENAVAIVDLDQRAVKGRVPTGTDPRAMALTQDGATLYVASYRSGQTDRYPYGTDPVEEERDITAIDTQAASVKTHFLDVGGMIQGLLLSEDEKRLFVSTTRNDVRVLMTDPAKESFKHMVLALDAGTGKELAAADLTRQPSSKGFAVTLHGLALAGGKLWVAAESSDLALALDPTTLEETARVEAKGRPRAILSAEGALFVHGAQEMTVTRVADGGMNVTTGETGTDPRPELVARGQRTFTGAGQNHGLNFACNTCHADGLSDTLVWKAGPTEKREASRPQFWLEGTGAIGWNGYVSSVRNFALAGNGTVGVKPTTDQFQGMAAYLSSLMPPPAANGKTLRDGALSEAALRGKTLYETKATCTGCHAMPLGTNRQLLAEGITPGDTDVPSLVGAYRHGVWLKHGDARDLRTAVTMVLDYLGNTSLSAGEIDDLTRYLEELTARDFFLLASEPEAKATAHVDQPIRLTFSYPIFEDAQNIGRIRLVDAQGATVAAKVTAEGRHVTVTPESALAPDSAYTVVIPREFESLGEQRMGGETRLGFQTAKPAALTLDGAYDWIVDMPVFNPGGGGFDPSMTVPVSMSMTATKTASGAKFVVDYAPDLAFDAMALVEGKDARLAPTPVPVGNNFADSRGITAVLTDDDGDGVADRAEGTMTVTGPGILLENLTFRLERPKSPDACEEGASGAVAVTLTPGPNGLPVMDWGDAAAISVYVTSPSAKLPLGPGQTVTEGETYWAIQYEDFASGFLGPVTYSVLPSGAVDITEANGGTAGGVPLVADTCYKFSVVTKSFQMGHYVVRWKQ
ncbi:Ig-like domain-containing protein [Polyangium aurulentum]|uniref:Ig-like domain-containing protein n=1 Tax=Polyangium aurulentum TaxID=2567896 RepID=UPI00146C18E2|nr:Ig-like domain-containing protein [Polyangium aurulentum]UQA61742.1 Ig-like domain-containing protein [Polyangium aurulentum]